MRNGILFSVVVHIAVILIAVLGLPLMQKPIEIQESIPIEIVDAGELAGPQGHKTPPSAPPPAQAEAGTRPSPSAASAVRPGGPASAGAGPAAPARAAQGGG